MKTIMLMVWANVKSNKLQSIALCVVFVAVSILFFLSLRLFGTMGEYEDLYTESNTSQGLIYVTGEETKDRIVQYLENNEQVKNVQTLAHFNNILETNIQHGNERIPIADAMLTEYASGPYDQITIIEGKPAEELAFNEVIFSYGKSKLNDLEVGDTVIIQTTQGTRTLVIAGIGVDLTYNFDTISLNRFWTNKETLTSLENGENEYSIGITYQAYSSSMEEELLDELNLLLGENASDILVIPFSLILQANSFFQLIMGSIFTLIGVILIVVGLFIIRSIIYNNIATESKKIATLKSTGFSSFNIISMYLFEYGVIAFMSIIVGIVASFALSDVVLRDINELANMFGLSQGINIAQTILAVLVMIGIIEVTVYMAARGVSKVKPAVALNRGEQVQETKAVFTMTKHQRLPLSFVLALKDVFYNKKMFLTLVLFIIATTFTVITLATTTVSLTSQKENNHLWLGVDIDAKLVGSEPLTQTSHQEVLDKLDESDYVLASVTVYNDFNSQVYDDYNEKYLSIISQLFVTDNKEPLNFSAVRGRIPENEQEIMLGQNLLTALQKEIGDYVKVRSLGEEKDLLIVGICQSMTNQGMTFRLFLDDLDEEYLSSSLIQMNFVDDVGEEELTKEINQIFGEDRTLVFESANASMLSMFDVLSLVTSGIIFIFVMISMVVLLNLNITNVNKERFNYGIYKSIGMDDQSIINIYLFKNSLVNVVGLIIGTSIALLTIPSIMNAITSQLGLNEFPTRINYVSIVLAIGIVFSVTFTNAFVIKGNISKITPKDLLIE